MTYATGECVSAGQWLQGNGRVCQCTNNGTWQNCRNTGGNPSGDLGRCCWQGRCVWWGQWLQDGNRRCQCSSTGWRNCHHA
ncbi:MAG: hypothetical protein MHM6MM_006977 [Cercozoa sp. M6MM]